MGCRSYGNLIPELLDPKGFPGAVMTAINVLYFKDKWERQFNAKQTKRAPFHLVGGKTADVDMMSQDIKLAIRENGRFVAAKLLSLS